MKVILLGYMGSGKSLLGKQLANLISSKFVDLDDYISEKESLSIAQIFKSKGEIYFRKIESTYLTELLNANFDHVIALGGGTPCYGDNMKIIKEHNDAKSIYLKASVQTLSQRLLGEMDKRPLLKNIHSSEALQEFVGRHLFERNHYYNLADVKITVDDKTEKDVLEELVLSLI